MRDISEIDNEFMMNFTARTANVLIRNDIYCEDDLYKAANSKKRIQRFGQRMCDEINKVIKKKISIIKPEKGVLLEIKEA